MAATVVVEDLEPIEPRGPAAYAAEFIGTFVLVLFIGLILASNTSAANGGLGFTDFAVIGLLHAFVLMMLVASLGGTSGAHFNPAVTATLAVLRKIAWADAAVYVLLQVAGAVAAALVVKLALGSAADVTNYGAAGITDNQHLITGKGGALLAEAIGTFALMWAIMGTAVNPRSERSWAPWVIGATLGFAVMAIGPLTGAGLNPARAFGPALVGNAFDGAGTFLLVYVLGPLLGALLAGLVYSGVILGERGLPLVRPVDKLDAPADTVAVEE
jgi:glycerol uptake facilitator protein